MPTNRFLNLKEEKKGLITQVLMEEFSSMNYNEVSINQIIKKASISRGSFYQYFEDKADAFLYIFESVTYNLIEASSKRNEKREDVFETIIQLCSDLYEETALKPEYQIIRNIMTYTIGAIPESTNPDTEKTYKNIADMVREVLN